MPRTRPRYVCEEVRPGEVTRLTRSLPKIFATFSNMASRSSWREHIMETETRLYGFTRSARRCFRKKEVAYRMGWRDGNTSERKRYAQAFYEAVPMYRLYQWLHWAHDDALSDKLKNVHKMSRYQTLGIIADVMNTYRSTLTSRSLTHVDSDIALVYAPHIIDRTRRRPQKRKSKLQKLAQKLKGNKVSEGVAFDISTAYRAW